MAPSSGIVKSLEQKFSNIYKYTMAKLMQHLQVHGERKINLFPQAR